MLVTPPPRRSAMCKSSVDGSDGQGNPGVGMAPWRPTLPAFTVPKESIQRNHGEVLEFQTSNN